MLNAGQKYCRMLQGEHSAILSTFIKLPFVRKIFVLSIFERPFYTGFTVLIWLNTHKFLRLLIYKICISITIKIMIRKKWRVLGPVLSQSVLAAYVFVIQYYLVFEFNPLPNRDMGEKTKFPKSWTLKIQMMPTKMNNFMFKWLIVFR